MNEVELKEYIDKISKELSKTPYGMLAVRFKELGLDIAKIKHEKKTDLIGRALAQLRELKQVIPPVGGHTVGVKPINSQKQNSKRQYTPDSKPFDLTVSTQSLLEKPDLKNPDAQSLLGKPDLKKTVALLVDPPIFINPDVQTTDTQNLLVKLDSENSIVRIAEQNLVIETGFSNDKKDLEEILERDFGKAELNKRSADPSERKLENENEISKKPETKIETAKPIRENVIAKPPYKKEVIEKNLKSIEANLKNRIPGQSKILMAKRKELEEMLKYYN